MAPSKTSDKGVAKSPKTKTESVTSSSIKKEASSSSKKGVRVKSPVRIEIPQHCVSNGRFRDIVNNHTQYKTAKEAVWFFNHVVAQIGRMVIMEQWENENGGTLTRYIESEMGGCSTWRDEKVVKKKKDLEEPSDTH
jgi:hypothetical protein